MTFASDLLPTLSTIRAIPGSLGLRPFRAYIVVRTWTGSDVGDGTYSDSESELLEGGQSPHVRTLTGEQIAVGQLPDETVEIANVTPTNANGGVDIDDLEGTLSAVQERWIKLVAADGDTRWMRIVDVGKDSALHYTVRVAPLQQE